MRHFCLQWKRSCDSTQNRRLFTGWSLIFVDTEYNPHNTGFRTVSMCMVRVKEKVFLLPVKSELCFQDKLSERGENFNRAWLGGVFHENVKKMPESSARVFAIFTDWEKKRLHGCTDKRRDTPVLLCVASHLKLRPRCMSLPSIPSFCFVIYMQQPQITLEHEWSNL